MNENLNLVEILKDCPKLTKLYSTIFGEVEFIECDNLYQIIVIKETKYYCFTSEGVFIFKGIKYNTGECTLFPSKDQRDWSKFKVKKPKFDPKTLQVFDKILARIDGGDAYCWFADFVSTPVIEKYDILPCIMSNKVAKMVIPYNEETKHLVGTTEEAPEFYRYWED